MKMPKISYYVEAIEDVRRLAQKCRRRSRGRPELADLSADLERVYSENLQRIIHGFYDREKGGAK